MDAGDARAAGAQLAKQIDVRSKRALVVTYVFPPVGGAGVQRITKVVKYLPERGWETTVLTAENPSVPVFDTSLLAGIPPQTRIFKARTLEPAYAIKRIFSAAARNGPSDDGIRARTTRLCRAAANVVLHPDPQILWRPAAVWTGLRVLAGDPHDVILVTAPPFSSFLIGMDLARHTGLPLVLDFRDEWRINQAYEENRQHSRLAQWRQRRLQQAVLRVASAVIASTKRSAQALARAACEANAHPLVTHIYNGYDQAELTAASSVGTSGAHGWGPPRNGYRLAHVGTLWNLTSVEPIVNAIVRLTERRRDLSAHLEFCVAGRRTAAQEALLHRLDGLPCRVTTYPYLDHDAALRLMQSADALLLLLSDVPEAERVVPAKIFEYMALGKPMYAVVPHGEVDELLEGSPSAFVHPPNDVDGLTRRLAQEIETRHDRRVAVAARNSRFERRALTGELAAVLDAVALPNAEAVPDVAPAEVSA